MIFAFGTASAVLFGQTGEGRRTQNSAAPVIKGKNVTVYLENTDFGVLAEKFVYDPNARLVDMQDEKSQGAGKDTGSIATAQYVNRISPGQPMSLKKAAPRPLGTTPSPKPLLGKPQRPAMVPTMMPAMEEISFGLLHQIPLT